MVKTHKTRILASLGLIFLIIASLGIVISGSDLTSPSPEAELAKCGHEENDAMRTSCETFIAGYCSTLKSNYWLREKNNAQVVDVGQRLPVLRPEHDALYPVDCYRQWWLGGATLTMHERTSRSFSQYPGFTAESVEYFAHRDTEGRLQLPKNYRVEQYSQHDQELLQRTLGAAYRYADVNAAVEDGYMTGKLFDDGMGIHFTNLSLLDETIDIDHPEFLTYIKSPLNNTYVLAQVGYIKTLDKGYKQFSYPLFEAQAAHGHNHFLGCIAVEEGNRLNGNMVNYEPSDVEIHHFHTPEGKKVVDWTIPKALQADQGSKQGDTRCFDGVWMLHVAVNLYNEDGLFADSFPLINTMVEAGEVYSFFGRRYEPRDYAESGLLQKITSMISRL